MYSFNQRFRPPQWFGLPAYTLFGCIALVLALVFVVYLMVIAGLWGVLAAPMLAFPFWLIRYGLKIDKIYFIQYAMSQGRQDQNTRTLGFKE
ncbi:hypothetical protein MED297_00095 [Reinekea sp. MED297]|uniref:Type IV secretory pathway, VirB3-like protein n=1 Tax=Reinekea blandensis MED297 TaxID=314283 RepID=A4BJX3_9GAMM|nr:hypothetical protein MED297_00095 [Reinekea sp. MED297] [Reinekea blandensis MED297]